MSQFYFCHVEMADGGIDSYKVINHYFEAGFLHLVYKPGTLSASKRYTTSISQHFFKCVTTTDDE